jgi:hypothetical protein
MRSAILEALSRIDLESLSLEEKKRLAVDLRWENYRAGEIKKILRLPQSEWAIQDWLRQANAVPSTRDLVLKKDGEGKDRKEIATTLRISRRRVDQIFCEANGPTRDYKTTEESIDLFLSEPERYMKAEFTQSPTFGWGLLKRCVEIGDENPKQALEAIEPSVALFDRIRRTRTKPHTRRPALCIYVQSRGIESLVYVATRRPMTAMAILGACLREIEECFFCEADGQRRTALVYAAMERWDDAWIAASGATDRYRSLGTCGHDLLGNGLANCMLLNSMIYFNSVSPEAAAAEARKGVAELTGEESPTLLSYLLFALAKYLLFSSESKQLAESEELLRRCFERIDAASRQSEPRAMLHWLKGQILVAKGLQDEAIDCLTLALEDAEACHLKDVEDILEDLTAFEPRSEVDQESHRGLLRLGRERQSNRAFVVQEPRERDPARLRAGDGEEGTDRRFDLLRASKGRGAGEAHAVVHPPSVVGVGGSSGLGCAWVARDWRGRGAGRRAGGSRELAAPPPDLHRRGTARGRVAARERVEARGPRRGGRAEAQGGPRRRCGGFLVRDCLTTGQDLPLVVVTIPAGVSGIRLTAPQIRSPGLTFRAGRI